MLFKNTRANVIEDVTNPKLIEQYKKRGDVYEIVGNDEPKMSYKEMKALATEMGLEFPANITKADLEKLIAENTAE